MDQVLDWIVSQLHLDGLTVLVLLVILSRICSLIGKLIPDNETGWKGYVRQGAKIIGLYASNRISPGVSVNSVAKSTMNQVPEVIDDIIQKKIREL